MFWRNYVPSEKLLEHHWYVLGKKCLSEIWVRQTIHRAQYVPTYVCIPTYVGQQMYIYVRQNIHRQNKHIYVGHNIHWAKYVYVGQNIHRQNKYIYVRHNIHRAKYVYVGQNVCRAKVIAPSEGGAKICLSLILTVCNIGCQPAASWRASHTK
jgi:hypothetical protein